MARNKSKNIFCNSEYHQDKYGAKILADYGKNYDLIAPLSQQLYQRNLFSTSAMVCSRELLIKYSCFDESLMNAQDYDLWLKISSESKPFFVREVLGVYKVREGNITSGSLEKKTLNLLKIAWKYRKYVSFLSRVSKFLKMLASYVRQKKSRFMNSFSNYSGLKKNIKKN